jgi:hypothetical protein
MGRCGLDSSGSEKGPLVGFCEYGNELSGSIKGNNFLTEWETISFLKRIQLHGVNYLFNLALFPEMLTCSPKSAEQDISEYNKIIKLHFLNT